MIIREALDFGRRRLASTIGANAGRDADLLLRHVTSYTQALLLTHPDRELSSDQWKAFQEAIDRRTRSEPIQYITGMLEFYGLAFAVTPDVLIPRAETEHLVEAALSIARRTRTAPSILDVGTGSGIVAITLAHHLPDASVDATDISPAALNVARQNASIHHLSSRITFMEADLLPPGGRTYDIICSNPPYVASTEVLEPQVSGFEPHTALFAGPDGLDIYRRLIPLAATALHPSGTLLLEIGHGQQPAIASLLYASHLPVIDFIPDLQGIPRVAIASRASLHGH